MRYLDRYEYKVVDGCHICTSHKCKIGGDYYGVKVSGLMKLLHRVIYSNLVGGIPEGYVIMHTCDNTLCINPDHLKAGTHQDNVRDMVNKGRNARGTKNPSAKLTDACIADIKSSTLGKWELSEKYGVNERTIRNVRAGRYWKHVN